MWRQKGTNAESTKHNGRGSLELKCSRYGALGVPIASTIAGCMTVSATVNVNTPQGQPVTGSS